MLQVALPDDAKIAPVFPLDKDTSKKNKISNFRPVSILTTFSIIYENVAKTSLKVNMKKVLSLFFPLTGRAIVAHSVF